jgi:hypothetical protein
MVLDERRERLILPGPFKIYIEGEQFVGNSTSISRDPDKAVLPLPIVLSFGASSLDQFGRASCQEDCRLTLKGVLQPIVCSSTSLVSWQGTLKDANDKGERPQSFGIFFDAYYDALAVLSGSANLGVNREKSCYIMPCYQLEGEFVSGIVLKKILMGPDSYSRVGWFHAKATRFSMEPFELFHKVMFGVPKRVIHIY